MTEELSQDEVAIGQQIRMLGAAGALARDPDAVARAAIGTPPGRRLMRLPLGLVASASVLLLVAVVALASVGGMGSSPATAQVGGVTLGGISLGGTTYYISVARSIDLSDARLSAIGEARQNSGIRTIGSTVYQVDDADPRQVLVMKLAPGERDDGGSLGEYLVLVHGNGFSLLCPYFRDGDPLAPPECR